MELLLAAQDRGWKISYGGLHDIWLRDGEAFGRLTRLEVADDPTKWFDLGEVAVTPLGDLDVILMRKEPPFDMEYIVATYVLERAEDRGNLVTGARAEVRPLTERDLWICEQIGPVLRDRGLLYTGIDVIGDFMTELNVTSPTGTRELDRASDVQIAERLLDAIQARTLAPPS